MPANTTVVQRITPQMTATFGYSNALVIARYLRISKEDDKTDESNSITNQRALIQNHISASEDFHGAKVIDYIDDGISGSHSDRRAYQQLLADVKSGKVHCIIVKDLSRIGRNMLDVDELLMNELVALKVRFIAINNGYDSYKHPLSNLELAIINLANQQYNKDLAVKSITSKHVHMKRGEYMSCWALYGYRKSDKEKNKIVVDETAAEYVRLIFSLAMDGNNASSIARILNTQGIPTPGEYKRQNGVVGGWKVIDPDYSFWCNALVGRLLHDERYTGKAISNMHRIKTPGKRNCVLRPREEWIIVPDAHEAIVSEEDFKKAHEAIKRVRMSDVPIDHIFWGKVKCPVCHRTMTRSGKYNPHFRCGVRKYTDHYDCPTASISQSAIEKVVLESIKVYSAAMIEQDELRLDALQRSNKTADELRRRIQGEERAIPSLKESITRNFTTMIEGKMTEDAFMEKKKVINSTIAHKEAQLASLREQLDTISVGKQVIDESLSKYRSWQTIEKLDREIVDLMIDEVHVHSETEIEIVWADKK